MNWRNAGLPRDPRPGIPFHERGGSRQRTRAAQIHNSDRTQARRRGNWKNDNAKGALSRYYAAMSGKTATLSAERSVFAWIPSSPNDKRPAHGNKAREVQ
eukprot:8050754-Pyramimonas_sp.AAC.1